jgi:competence protein ComFA
VGLFTLCLLEGAAEDLLFLSPDPTFDLHYLGAGGDHLTMTKISPPLPLGIAAYLWRYWQQVLERTTVIPAAVDLSRWARNGLEELRNLDGCRPYWGKTFYPVIVLTAGQGAAGTVDRFPAADELAAVAGLLRGRLLRLSEIGKLLGTGRQLRSLERILQVLYLKREAVCLPAVIPVKGSLVRCQRCGWEGPAKWQTCAGCGSEYCCHCPECLVMGDLSLCEPLYTAAPLTPFEMNRAPNGTLHGFQRLAQSLRRLWPGEDTAAWEQELISRPLTWPRYSGSDSPVAGLASTRSTTSAEHRPGSASDDGSRAGRPGRGHSGAYRLDVQLTSPQQGAVKRLLDFGAADRSGTCLVWAACGAGKTEVSFPLIGQALGGGRRVLFATPRRDVVLELAPRLSQAFGREHVAALYGGSSETGKSASLVVATTHQTLRFYHDFDLVILDEGDAYPYPDNRMLHYGVKRARRKDGQLVYLTATPASWMIDEAMENKVDIIKIPSRPHGFPLPEPQILKVSPLIDTRRGRQLHPSLLELIRSTEESYQVPIFLFVPTVEMAGVVGKALRQAAGQSALESFRSDRVEWSHAGDQRRDEKRKRFFNGEFPLFVATTIMERGVTKPFVHVLVLDAGNAAVFDTPTLVQMSGRCGRSPEYPTGEVWMISETVSREMEEARAQIRSFNREAQQAGYLRDDYQEALRKIVDERLTHGSKK